MFYGYIIIVIDILCFYKITTNINQVPVKILKITDYDNQLITLPIFGKNAQRLVLANDVIGFIIFNHRCAKLSNNSIRYKILTRRYV